MPEIYDTPIIQKSIQALKEREAKEEYLDSIVSGMSEFKVSGKPLTDKELIVNDLQHGSELFNLQEFSPKVQTDILLSLAYFRSPAFRERIDTSLGYAPGSEITPQDVETYNKIVDRAEEAYSGIIFEVENDIAKSHHMITFDGKSIVRIPDGNDQHELDSKLYSSLGVTTHEIAHYIYNSAVPDSINPGVHHQGEGESLTPSESYGRDNSPYNRINESDPTKEQVADWYAKKDLERIKDLYEGGILSKDKYDKYVQRISGMSPEQLAEHEHVDTHLRHDNTGFERAADVHAARMIMLQEGIWNPFSGEPLKREHIEEFQKRHPDSRIFEYWNNREATYFLNTIAQNEKNGVGTEYKESLQQFVKNFDSGNFMQGLRQFSSAMFGGHEIAQGGQPETSRPTIGRGVSMSSESLMALSAINYETEMQYMDEGQQEHRSYGHHI